MASNDKISIWRAEAVTLNFNVQQTDDLPSDPENITGWTLAFTVAPIFDSPTKTLTKAGTVTDGPNGKCSVALTATETNIAVGSYKYDLWRTDAGQERPLSVGVFNVLPSARIPTA
jgi:hypothetical protein